MTDPLVTCVYPHCNGRDGPGIRPYGYLIKRSECKCQSRVRVPVEPEPSAGPPDG